VTSVLPAALRVALTIGAAALALYALVLVALWFGQERLLFMPDRLDPSRPLSTAADIHESLVDVPGARLSLLELRLPDPKGVVFFLHGNAGSLASWFVNAEFYRQANFDLVMLDYRGYGKSTGRIEGEGQLHDDVRAVWSRVAPRYAGRRVVVYGRSLGTGLAAALAAQLQPDLTVLVSPYSSLIALAQTHYPWVPAAVLRYTLRTDLFLAQVRTPVLLVHGERDSLIPPAHSRTLAALRPNIVFAPVPEAAHNDLQDFEHYRRTLATALQSL